MTIGLSQLERHLDLERGAILRLVDRGVLPAQRVAGPASSTRRASAGRSGAAAHLPHRAAEKDGGADDRSADFLENLASWVEPQRPLR